METIFFHLNQLGDFVFSIPALISYRKSFPDAFIVSIVRPAFAEILIQSGLVDRVLSRNSGISKRSFDLIKQLRMIKPDVAVSFSQSASCAIFSYLSGANIRVGFHNTTLGFLLNKRIDMQHPPSVENNIRLVQSMGCKIIEKDYFSTVRISEQATQDANNLLQQYGINQSDKTIILSPATSSRRTIKEWDNSKFAEVGKWLIENDIKPVILGNVPSTEIKNMNNDILDLSGKTTILQAAAIIKKSLAVVSVDSGLLHLSEAVGTNVVGLYGPSNHTKTGPIGAKSKVVRAEIDCSPCMKKKCKINRECMKQISSEQVIDALKSILDEELVGA